MGVLNPALIREAAVSIAADLPLDDIARELSRLFGSFIEAADVSIVVPAPARRDQLSFEDGALTIPIKSGSRCTGLLRIASPRTSYSEEEVAFLESCAIYLGMRVQSVTDALTGISNRRAFDEALQREWQRCARGGEPLSVLLLDVDYFKLFNDAYGHPAGDECLRLVAQAIASCAKRAGDVAARYGGEEFAVILPEAAANSAVAVAEAIREALRRRQIPHEGSSLGYTTLSVGCASVVPRVDENPQSLIELADAQLYRAKAGGRNRVVLEAYFSDSPVAERRALQHDNLPAVTTSFVGRESEMLAIEAHLRDNRLVTLAGPGGVGKTRLAIEVGKRDGHRYPDGVWFVDLAPLREARFVGTSALLTFDLREEPGRQPSETLARALRDKRLLLIFDNCEHVVAEVAAL
ncbi:MAG: diguanylate cyclase, partial [Candidatus Eremiobacteraeota bacterium]|nr:diguanylate cyclase [Candidatus Eremiobacteraeota bacterium]